MCTHLNGRFAMSISRETLTVMMCIMTVMMCIMTVMMCIMMVTVRHIKRVMRKGYPILGGYAVRS